jgi:hypothetical protein
MANFKEVHGTCMGVRTVRLDEEAEKQLAQQTPQAPYDIYAALDLGPGGYAIAPSTETRYGVQEAVKRKLRR